MSHLVENNNSSEDGLRVLSLCDGMSCGHIALDKAGIKVDKYFASEIKEIGIKVTKYNYPDTIHIGDVNKITYENGILHTEVRDFKTDIDIVIFGSPCQTFSVACKTDKRIGLEDNKKSGLFKQCYRILKETNPRYFFMENVASMKNDDRDFISDLMGVKPYKIDAQLVSPELRKRYYWTNIKPFGEIKGEKNITLQEILTDGYTDRLKARNLLVSDSRPLVTPVKMFHRYYSTGFTTLIFKNKQHYEDCVSEYEKLSGGKRKISAKDLDNYTGDVFNGVRYMNQEELEKCQCVPTGYTQCLNRNDAADVLGDGWNIDVIKWFFCGINK